MYDTRTRRQALSLLPLSQQVEDAAQQYGQAIIDRVNFVRYRPLPNFSLNASLGLVLQKSDRYPIRLQIDGNNLTDQIHVIDFAGLFSGTAIGVSRSVDARLQFQF